MQNIPLPVFTPPLNTEKLKQGHKSSLSSADRLPDRAGADSGPHHCSSFPGGPEQVQRAEVQGAEPGSFLSCSAWGWVWGAWGWFLGCLGLGLGCLGLGLGCLGLFFWVPCSPCHAETQPGTGFWRAWALLVAVSSAVDKVIAHFSTARNVVQKAQLGDSRLNPDVGYLLLHTLCPALCALVEDGLKPFQKDVITGQRRNSPWSVVEASPSQPARLKIPLWAWDTSTSHSGRFSTVHLQHRGCSE
uniref:Farnesyl diphosphate synthase n=1 Tax=Zonotrichia albicollis TaxID=44394 RepID=A0A8D2MUV2_ZONAL